MNNEQATNYTSTSINNENIISEGQSINEQESLNSEKITSIPENQQKGPSLTDMYSRGNNINQVAPLDNQMQNETINTAQTDISQQNTSTENNQINNNDIIS